MAYTQRSIRINAYLIHDGAVYVGYIRGAMPEPASYDPEFECLKNILAVVQSKVRKDAPVSLICYFLSDTPRDPSLAYIGFIPNRDHQKKVTHTPGIPCSSLVKEKVEAIGLWVVRQISKEHPEWFAE